MTRDDAFWSEVESVFDSVVDLDAIARAAVLDAHAVGRPDVRVEVERLLAADAQSDGFLESSRAPGVGSQIGAFRLIEQIGVGGMGTVYRADRVDGDFAQQVAVKILSTPNTHAAAARRFRAERQILASLRHPHIVSLLDGGVTPGRHAYLVMEYVDGVPVSAFCRERALALAKRLHLFRAVCSAVHYAHRHGVVHRDLKPANILVTDDGVPKVLDFGVAKLLNESHAAGATVTAAGVGPLTPNYASPEQLRGLPITTSCDVYALGVLLYQLIADVRPYETEGKPLDEILRLVAESNPPRPSARNRSLSGDLDAITSRAMAKNPEERYRSAEELADDIARFLAGTPVVAREPSLAYVMRKLAARHRVAFASSAVALVLVVGALVTALWQARVATAQRQRAEQRFGEVRQLANALIFEIHDAVAPLAGSTPVRRTIVARALEYLERLAAEARGDAALQLELARAYIRIGRVQGLPGTSNLGDREGALESFRKAQTLVGPLVRVRNPSTGVVEQFVEASRRLSETLQAVGGRRRDEAAREAQKAVAVAEAYLRREPTDLKARNMLASASFTAALALNFAPASLPDWERARALYEAILAERPNDSDTLRNVGLVAKYLGTYYELTQDDPRALLHYERARVLDETRLARNPDDRNTQLDLSVSLSSVGNIRRKQRDPTAAEIFERSLKLREAISASDPKDVFARQRVAYVQAQLASVYEQAAQFPVAFVHARRAIEIFNSMDAADSGRNVSVGDVLFTLGRLEDKTGRRADACASYGRALDHFNKIPEMKDFPARLKDLEAVKTLVDGCRR